MALVAGTAAVFAASTWVAMTHPGVAYFMLPTRSWEFFVGRLVALLPSTRARGAAALGIGGITVSTALLTSTSLVHGPALLPAILGTALVLAGPDRDPVSRALGLGGLCWVGDRSYAIYLAHWPKAGWLYLSTAGDGSTTAWHLAGVAWAVGLGHVLHMAVEAQLHHGMLARRGPAVRAAGRRGAGGRRPRRRRDCAPRRAPQY